MKETVLITGANGNLGKKFLLSKSGFEVCALVRSKKAESDLINFITKNNIDGVEIVICDYLDLEEMRRLVKPCVYVLHLVGIIKEKGINNFDLVHRQTTRVLIDAIKGSKVKKICYISLLGSNERSKNTCFSSRGIAEKLFLNSGTPSLLLQVPMVLGEDDYASYALKKNALSRLNFTFRKSSLEQPIYAGDIIKAIEIDVTKCLKEESSVNGIKILAGPNSLTREQLVKKTAELLKVNVKVISLPIFLGYTLARIFEVFSSNSPISSAMLGVLDHDDCIDPLPGSKELGIELTTLDKMLEKTMLS